MRKRGRPRKNNSDDMSTPNRGASGFLTKHSGYDDSAEGDETGEAK